MQGEKMVPSVAPGFAVAYPCTAPARSMEVEMVNTAMARLAEVRLCLRLDDLVMIFSFQSVGLLLSFPVALICPFRHLGASVLYACSTGYYS